MQEVQALCQRVIIIDNGTIVADKAVDQLKDASVTNSSLYTVRVSFENSVTKEQLSNIEGVVEVTEDVDGGFLLLAPDAQNIRATIFHHAVAQNWTLIELTEQSHSLEQIFKDLTGKGGVRD
jgi:ABC-2 type transport system ATP-binding protein